uniref:Ig-like domain-containing protein n=1 Tax=Lates calcarifer TaxID=8187 RepID=A0A4W6CWL3_LATCA
SSLPWLSLHMWPSNKSFSESQTVEVQSGEEATLLCSNFTTSPSQIIWFRLTNRTQPRFMSWSDSKAEYCDGYEAGNFQMRSNSSTVYLKIKQVDVSDSGQYFCGFYTDGRITFTEFQNLNFTSSKIIVKSFLSFHSHCSVMSFSVLCSVTVSIMYLILLLLKILLNLSKNA